MIDAQYAQLTDKTLAAVRKISNGPIRYLVNTHVHRDHTAGNAFFAKQGAVIFAREELRESMVKTSKAPNASANPLSDPTGWPVITYGMGDPIKIRMNGEITDFIPIRAAHTGGDTIIRFENANVIFIGDFYRNYGFPFIDIANGGSLKGMIAGLEETMKLAGPDTVLVPGHGTLIKRSDMVPYRDMIIAVRDKMQPLISQGKSVQEVMAANITAPYATNLAGATKGEHRPCSSRKCMRSFKGREVNSLVPGAAIRARDTGDQNLLSGVRVRAAPDLLTKKRKAIVLRRRPT